MKKGFSIIMALLMVTATFHATVATHFCGGAVAASIVSLSGKLASCGMEVPENKPVLPGINITAHCCDDAVTSCLTDNNFKPSFSDVPESCQYNYEIFRINARYPFYSEASLSSLSPKIRPPGELMSTYVNLPAICVFRI